MSRHNTRKGQSALEFLILAGCMFVATSMLTAVLSEHVSLVAEFARDRELQSVGEQLIDEVRSAYRVHDGYEREFTLPTLINGEPYTLTLEGGREISVSTQREKYVAFLPTDVRYGQFNLSDAAIPVGSLIIEKRNNLVTLRTS